MGGAYEVSVWGQWDGSEGYSYLPVYLGHSLLKALWVFWRSRNDGTGCVQFCYRRGL